MIKWRMIPAVALSAFLAIPAAAMAQEAEQMAAEQASAEAIHSEIATAQAEFVAALNGDDPASAADSYSANAVIMPPGLPAAEGIDAIREFFAPGMQGATLALEIWDVHAQGSDVALETGGFEITSAEGEHLDHGKYVAVWTRTDDGWKMKYDIWNSSMAPRAGHAEMHERMHGEGDAHEMKEKAEGEMKEQRDMDDDGDAVDDMDEDEEM